jgi:RNA polymerase sigma factor (sigma-70 family)
VTFEELYESEYQRMVRLAFSLVDTQPIAEAVVQDAFASMLERFEGINNPMAHVRRAVLKGCRRARRGRKGRRSQPVPVLQNSELAVNHVIDSIRGLPYKQRSMVVLRYDLQLTDVEIAETFEIPTGNVQPKIYRALRALRKELSDV